MIADVVRREALAGRNEPVDRLGRRDGAELVEPVLDLVTFHRGDERVAQRGVSLQHVGPFEALLDAAQLVELGLRDRRADLLLERVDIELEPAR